MVLRSESGFTLVEMLVVVAVLALLATLAIPRAFTAINSSREAKVAHDLVAIQGALERHYADLGYYPVKLNDLLKHGYLKAGFRFKSPATNKWYFYAVDDNRDEAPHAYILGAPGRDSNQSAKLYHRRPLPLGKDANDRAIPWIRFDSSAGSSMLYLTADDDESSWKGPLPTSLDFYRTGCLPDTPEPCDAVTN